MSLAALRGEVVLVYFFSTWCFPCLVEMKTLTTLQQENESKGFHVVAVGMDLEGAKVLKPFAESAQAPYPILIADDTVRRGESPYGLIRSLPTSYLLDRQGHVAAAYEGPADPTALQSLVGELVR